MTLTKTVPIQLSTEEMLRYGRHLTLCEVGLEGQKRLKTARVLCVGAGGLGSPVLLYLAAAGVGTLGIVDNDIVEMSNLQRQILYSTAEINNKKVTAAKSQLLRLNPHINIVTYEQHLNSSNALEFINSWNIVVDGTDNFAARYLINDACFHLKKPHVYASVSQFEGQCTVFTAPTSSCYRCLYETPPPPELTTNCAEAGVLGVLPGLMGNIQAMEVLKLILGIGSPLIGRLLLFDGLAMRFREFALQKNPDCFLCVHQQSFDSLPYHSMPICNSVADETSSISVQELAELKNQQADFMLLDVREPYEHALCQIGGKLIPLNELANRINELDTGKRIIVYCKSGGRSKQAVKLLKSSGFPAVFFLAGGIMAWAKEIDPALPRY